MTASQNNITRVTIDAYNVKAVSLIYLLFVSVYLIPSVKTMLTLIIVKPVPSKRLKTGPAMQPVIAISPNPFLLIAILAKASPIELPHESTVNPRREAEIPEMH